MSNPHWKAACDARRDWAKDEILRRDYREAVTRYLSGLTPENPPGSQEPASVIAAHLADVVDERIFRDVYAEVLGAQR